MRTRARLDPTGELEILVGETTFLAAIRAAIPAWDLRQTEYRATAWESRAERDALGSYACYRSTVSQNGRPALLQTLRDYGPYQLYSLRALRDLDGLEQADSFASHTVCAPHMLPGTGLRALAVTFGLGAADDPFGGYWPAAALCTSTDLPASAFAPLILWNAEGALAIAPANAFLTGSLGVVAGGLSRGWHGSIGRLVAHTEIETLVVAGADPASALMALGDLLLRRGMKKRPDPADHPLTSTVGWWNAYGGYYTEPIHPLDATELRSVTADVAGRQLPIGYLGLDLWYPYAHIGQGTEFAPDRSKYPDGVGAIAETAGLPTVLHVSALAQPNAYGSDGSDGRIYRRIGEEVRRQRGVAVWHDWMRTQQHLTRMLRSQPEVAETWYHQMTSSLAGQHLEILQCMQTMGMALASTQAANVRAARTSIDYLFALPEAIDTLAEMGQEGFRREAVRPIDLYRQNLMMGMVLYSLGLLPFHDLFLTTFHTGIGGARPLEDAILRALSCGPVGIGDAPGKADRVLLERLTLSSGRLLQPDRPPFPDPTTLGAPVELYWTLHEADKHAWLYVLLLNPSMEAQVYDVDPPVSGEYVVRDGACGSTLERMTGTLQPGAIAYFTLSPRIRGIAPLGLVDKLVPAPAGRLSVSAAGRRVELTVDGLDGTFGVHCDSPIEITADGEPLDVARNGSLHTVCLKSDHTSLLIRRR